jgi:hypothetical protein
MSAGGCAAAVCLSDDVVSAFADGGSVEYGQQYDVGCNRPGGHGGRHVTQAEVVTTLVRGVVESVQWWVWWGDGTSEVDVLSWPACDAVAPTTWEEPCLLPYLHSDDHVF